MSNQDTDLAWRIMEAAGGTRIRVEEYAPGYYLVASREHGAGVTSPKEDAFDTVQEVALHLVSQQAVARAREQDKAAAAAEVQHVATAEFDAIIAANSGSGGDPDAGERQVGDGYSAHPVPTGDAGSGDDVAPDDDGGELGDEPGASGVTHASDCAIYNAPALPPGPCDCGALDAEFEEPQLEGADLELGEQIEPELILIENDPDDIAVEEPEPREHGSPGGVVYFGDNIDTIRLAKIGRLADIARALKDVLREGWTLAEFASLQNLIVRIDRGEAPHDEVAEARWKAIGERSRAMDRVDEFKEQRELQLQTTDRDFIELFDPEEGWPE